MAEKEFNTRIIHKHDIQANWEKAVGFIPKQGELIVYDADENYDYQRIKIGDGVTNVNDLSFWDKGIEDKLIENAPNLEADRGEPGYIENRPGYRKINKAVNTFIEVVEVGNYCLLDFSTVHESFVNNYLTYEELIRDYSRTYDFYYSYDTVEAETGLLWGTSLVRVGDRIKLLDDINCYINVLTSGMTFYIIHNRDLLSEELKEKIPYNGIWLISNQAVDPYGGQRRNFWFREYIYTKFDPNLIPDDVMFKRDMGEYVTQEEMDGAIADLHAVQYTEQTLIEEEQMQARKNLGLYYKHEEKANPTILVEEHTIYSGHVINFENSVFGSGLGSLDEDLYIEIIGNDTGNVLYSGNYTKQGDWGTDYSTYAGYNCSYWGNRSLIQNDEEAWPLFYDWTSSSNTLYDDIPFVVYYAYHEDNLKLGVSRMYISDGLVPTGISFSIKIGIDNGETILVHEQIPEEYLPDSILNTINNEVVKYTEQSLTEEQQMQARKNLGLYGSREESVILGEINSVFGGETVDLAGYVMHAGLVLDTTKPLVMELFDPHTNTTVHSATYYPQGEDYFDQNQYVDCSYWYWGNHALLQNDTTAWEKLSHYEDKNGYDDAPFVIYSLHNDDIGWHRKLILSSDLEYPGGGGYTVILRSTEKETVYDKIPEEYLPDTAAKKSDIPTDIVQYTEQTLTDEQKLQARANIEAAGAAMIVARDYSTLTTVDGVTKIKADHTFEEIKAWHDAGGIVLFKSTALMPVLSISSSKIIFAGIHWAGEEPGFSKVTIDTDGYVITENSTPTITVPDNLAVGQVLSVKSVGANVSQTEWETIDIPTQIQADWSQTDEAAVDFIKNKPEIATDDDVINALVEADLLCCVTDSDGSILTDESENILLW